MKIWCRQCEKFTEHKFVDSKLDKKDGWKVNGIRSQGGCRDSGADYRTSQCKECEFIHTGDFATD